MRELKFRIMYKKYPNIWLKDEHTLRDLIEMDGNGFLDDDDIIEQYTGLKDKNGKEIYEGDIVTMNLEYEELEPGDCELISFSDGCFRVGNDYEDEAGSYLQDWRVIGNIHENPEFLGGEK